MPILEKSKKKHTFEEKDVKEFYSNKKTHKISSLKKLVNELDS